MQVARKMILSSHLGFVQGWLIQLDAQSMAFFAPPLNHLASLFKMCPSSASKERIRGKQTEWELRGKKSTLPERFRKKNPHNETFFSPFFTLFWSDVEIDDLICCSAQTYRGKRVDQAVVTDFFFCFPKPTVQQWNPHGQEVVRRKGGF